MTVRITLTEPVAPILSMLVTPWYTAIASRDFAPENNANPLASGTGPFKFVEYVPNDHVTLEKNPDYRETGFPCFDGLEFRIVPELQAQISAFRQGNVDIVAMNDPTFIPLLKDKPDIQLMPPPGPVNESGLALNNAEGPTAEVNVRRALSLGIDRQAMIVTVLFGHGEIGTKIPCGEAPWSGSPIPIRTSTRSTVRSRASTCASSRTRNSTSYWTRANPTWTRRNASRSTAASRASWLRIPTCSAIPPSR